MAEMSPLPQRMTEDMTVRNLSPAMKRFQRLMADNGVACGMSQSGNVWDNVAMEGVFPSLKTERIGRKIYRMRDQVRADVFGYIERFYNPTRRHSTLGISAPWTSKGRRK